MTTTRRFIFAADPAPGFTALVLANSAVNPFTVEEEILAELRARGETGLVAFDLLLSNGHKHRRFFAAYFDGKDLAIEEAVHSGQDLLPASQDVLRTAATSILQAHFDKLSPSLLTPAMQYAMRNGIAI